MQRQLRQCETHVQRWNSWKTKLTNKRSSAVTKLFVVAIFFFISAAAQYTELAGFCISKISTKSKPPFLNLPIEILLLNKTIFLIQVSSVCEYRP